MDVTESNLPKNNPSLRAAVNDREWRERRAVKKRDTIVRPIHAGSEAASSPRGSSGGRSYVPALISPRNRLTKTFSFRRPKLEDESNSEAASASDAGTKRMSRTRSLRGLMLSPRGDRKGSASIIADHSGTILGESHTSAKTNKKRKGNKYRPKRIRSLSASSSNKKVETQIPLKAVMKRRRKRKSQECADKFDVNLAASPDITLAITYCMQRSELWQRWDFDQASFLNAFVMYHLKVGDLMLILSKVLEKDLAKRNRDTYEALLREGTSFTCKIMTTASQVLECGGTDVSCVELAAERAFERIMGYSLNELKGSTILPRYCDQALRRGIWELEEGSQSSEDDIAKAVTAISKRNVKRCGSLVKREIDWLLGVGEEDAGLQIAGAYKGLLGLLRTRVLHALNKSRDHGLTIPKQHALALEQVGAALFLKRFNSLLTIISSQTLADIKDRTSPEYAKAWHVNVFVVTLTKVSQKFANHSLFADYDGPLQNFNPFLEKYREIFDKFLDNAAPIVYGGRG